MMSIRIINWGSMRMGFSRAAYIVARAKQRRATRPFAETQSVPLLGSIAPAAIN
jgi:hypothetical protein